MALYTYGVYSDIGIDPARNSYSSIFPFPDQRRLGYPGIELVNWGIFCPVVLADDPQWIYNLWGDGTES